MPIIFPHIVRSWFNRADIMLARRAYAPPATRPDPGLRRDDGKKNNQEHAMLKNIFTIIMITTLTGCALYPAKINFHASHVLNQNKNKKSLPVAVKIYQLTDSGPLRNAAFANIWQNAKQTLGKTVIATKSLMLNPGEWTNITINRKRAAKYLAIVAIFRNPSSHWRVIKKLPKPLPLVVVHLRASLTHNRIGMN